MVSGRESEGKPSSSTAISFELTVRTGVVVDPRPRLFWCTHCCVRAPFGRSLERSYTPSLAWSADEFTRFAFASLTLSSLGDCRDWRASCDVFPSRLLHPQRSREPGVMPFRAFRRAHHPKMMRWSSSPFCCPSLCFRYAVLPRRCFATSSVISMCDPPRRVAEARLD